MGANQDEGYDRDAALATLSPEERAALEDDGLSDDDRNALQNIAGQDGTDDDDEGDDDDQDGAGNDDGDADGANGDGVASSGDDGSGAAAGDGGQSAQTDADDDADDDSGPIYEAALPADFDDRIKALDTRADDLAAKFKAGDIDPDEFIAENRRIADERAELERVRTEVSVADRLNAQNAQYQWQRVVKGFMKEIKADEGIDYANDPEKAEKFELFVKALAGDAKNEGKSFKWYLSQAHKATKAVLGIADKPAAQKRGGAAKPEARKPPIDAVPKNLAHVPGADGPGDVGGDEFAEIDRLSGEDYENAMAKMTPAQRQRYLEQA